MFKIFKKNKYSKDEIIKLLKKNIQEKDKVIERYKKKCGELDTTPEDELLDQIYELKKEYEMLNSEIKKEKEEYEKIKAITKEYQNEAIQTIKKLTSDVKA